MRHFCIITNRNKDIDFEITDLVAEYIRGKDMSCYVAEQYNDEDGRPYTDSKHIPESAECIIVLGGDGTMIHTAHDLIDLDIPMIGINLGTLGFLATIERLDILKAIDCLISDEYIIEERMMLEARIIKGTGSDEYLSFNDVVITRSGFSRLISTSVYVNDAFVNAYSGDGIIISTPTGSTGYSLSAGGPIVTPSAELIVITPICPHSLNARSIVAESSNTVEVCLQSRRKSQDEEAIVTIDGIEIDTLNTDDHIEIVRSSKKTRLIRFKDRSFFDILHTKLEVR